MVDKPCKLCGTMIFGVHPHKQHCQECHKKRRQFFNERTNKRLSYEAAEKRKNKTCAFSECGKTFDAVLGNQKYCSDKCYRDAHNAKKRNGREKRVLKKHLPKPVKQEVKPQLEMDNPLWPTPVPPVVPPMIKAFLRWDMRAA